MVLRVPEFGHRVFLALFFTSGDIMRVRPPRLSFHRRFSPSARDQARISGIVEDSPTVAECAPLREPTIARNYAEALFEAGERTRQTERFAELIEAVATAIESDATVRAALESPRVPKATKQQILARALRGHAPETFVRFVTAVIKRGRQSVLPSIRAAYLELVDQKLNRIHCGVMVARQPDPTLAKEIQRRLSKVVGKEVIPHFRQEPGILGGVIVRVGDQIMDGSLRRKMVALRRQMLKG